MLSRVAGGRCVGVLISRFFRFSGKRALKPLLQFPPAPPQVDVTYVCIFCHVRVDLFFFYLGGSRVLESVFCFTPYRKGISQVSIPPRFFTLGVFHLYSFRLSR